MASLPTSWGQASPLLVALLVAGCGDYAPANGGGTGGSSGQTGSGGAPGSGGTAGSGQAGSAGAAGSGGQAGSAGAAGSGGQAGSAGGCSSGQAGAGGSAGPLNCPDPLPSTTPCGGDVVGTWAAASCPLMVTGQVDMTSLGLGCASAEVTSGSLQVTGTWTADSCGIFTDTTRTTGEQEVELPPSCLMVSGTTTSCDQVGDPVGSVLGYATFDCVDNAETGGCTCSATIDQEGGIGFVSIDASASGTYTTADSTLTTTVFGTDTEYAYCVSGNTLTMNVQTVSKTGTVMGALVLQKQ
jgi:hypothetical protein